MAPVPLRMALPVRPVRVAWHTSSRPSRAVRVRANADELSRIAEIEEEIARQVRRGRLHVLACRH